MFKMASANDLSRTQYGNFVDIFLYKAFGIFYFFSSDDVKLVLWFVQPKSCSSNPGYYLHGKTNDVDPEFSLLHFQDSLLCELNFMLENWQFSRFLSFFLLLHFFSHVRLQMSTYSNEVFIIYNSWFFKDTIQLGSKITCEFKFFYNKN